MKGLQPMMTQCCQTFKNWVQKPTSILRLHEINQKIPRGSGTGCERSKHQRTEKATAGKFLACWGDSLLLFPLTQSEAAPPLHSGAPPPPSPARNTGSTHPQALSNLVLLNRTNTLRSHLVSAHWHDPAVQKRLSVCACVCAVPGSQKQQLNISSSQLNKWDFFFSIVQLKQRLSANQEWLAQVQAAIYLFYILHPSVHLFIFYRFRLVLHTLQVFQQEVSDSLVQHVQEVKFSSEEELRADTRLSLESLLIASHTSSCDPKLFRYSLEVY